MPEDGDENTKEVDVEEGAAGGKTTKDDEAAESSAGAADEADAPMDDNEAAADDGHGAEAGEEATPEAEVPKEPERPKELELDAPDDPRPKLAPGAVVVTSGDCNTSFNAVPSHGGRVLLPLADGGLHHLLAAARASVGVRGGRYVFEVQPIEGARCQPSAEGKGNGKDTRAPQAALPKPFFAVGFSTAQASLFLGDDANSCGFDSEGNFLLEGDQLRVSQRIAASRRHQNLSVLLNLDASTANMNTVSLFCDGRRLCPPQPLPEALRGRTLFPTVNYKNVTLRMNFGPEPSVPLPFRCRMLQDAAQEDVEAAAPTKVNDKRQVEVIFPVGLPDEGTFEWLDGFLRENPSYTELSDRALLEWARRSGLPRAKGYQARNSNDRPGMELGIVEFDNASVKRTLATMATDLGRDCVVMEVRNNLLAAERRKMLEHYSGPEFRRVAMVVMGDPPAAFKAAAQERTLAEKKQQVASEVRRSRLSSEKKATDKSSRGTNKEEDKDAQEKAEEGEKNPDVVAEEPLEEAVKKAVDAVQLTEEERQLSFYRSKTKDLSARELGRQFGNFTIPAKDEGFDEIKFVWNSESECEAYLSKWISDKKLTQRIEDLQPGEWFRGKWSEWQDVMDKWRWAHAEWRDPSRRQQKKRKTEGGEDSDEERNADEKDGDASMDAKLENSDVYTVDNVFDIGNGEPLFANFVYEDWTLLSLRAEFHLLVHAFRHDVNDPERPTFHVSHLGFYYQKYFRKPFEVKQFGFASPSDLLALVKDTIETDPSGSGMLETMLSDDSPFDNFIKLTEDCRRERCIAVDAGDDSAKLTFLRPLPAGPERGSGASQKSHGRPTHGGKGGGRDRHGGAGYGGFGGKGGRDAGGFGGRMPPPPPLGMAGGDRRYGGDPRGCGGPGGMYGGYPSGYGHLPPPPPPRSGYGSAPAPSSSAYGGAHKRPVYDSPPPHSHHDGYRGNGAPPYKQARSSYAPPPSRGGYGGGGSYGRR